MKERYTLKWSTFSEHLQLILNDLFEEEQHSVIFRPRGTKPTRTFTIKVLFSREKTSLLNVENDYVPGGRFKSFKSF